MMRPRHRGRAMRLLLGSILMLIALGLIAFWRAKTSTSPQATSFPSSTSQAARQSSTANAAVPFSLSTELLLGDLKFVLIPEGSFIMGSPTDEPGREENERQSFGVVYDAFYLLTTEVTQAQFTANMGVNPSPYQNGSLPVTNVNWDEAEEFCHRLNATYSMYVFRLPTEMEWEFACRAGATAPFAVPPPEEERLRTALAKARAGDEDFLTRFVKQFARFGESNAQPAAERLPNAWGLHDMLGNVWEWCDGSPDSAESDLRPIRGGAYSSTTVWGCRSAVRGAEFRETRKPSIGFRILAQPRQ
ncbi:MAG: formylglycine-generating enzyme family protein [Planctomycetaceae bacterium]|nr:formylglycine-generating enzyme family protein [Planctomycetaceae bacterium]